MALIRYNLEEMIKEIRLGRWTEKTRPLNHEEQIDRLLHSPAPLVELERVCQRIPERVECATINRLWQEGNFIELTYLCLPTLKTALEKYNYFGIPENALFETGFFAMQRGLLNWPPQGEPVSDKVLDIKMSVSLNIRGAIEESIVRIYGLAGKDQFPVVRLYRQCWLDFVQEEGRVPSFYEIDEKMWIENTNLELETYSEESGMRIEKSRIIFNAFQPALFYEEIGMPEFRIGEVVDEKIMRETAKRTVAEALLKLKTREAEVLRRRFGISEQGGGEEKQTLEEIAMALGITHERVRQIESMALTKSRHHSLSKALEEYY